MTPDTRIYFDPPVTEGATFAVSREAKTKDTLEKIGKLIPGEILGAYGAALGTLPLFNSKERLWVGAACFILGMIGTGWYVGWRIDSGIVKQKHVLVYMGAFAVWAYSLTGITVLPWIYHPGFAALLPIVAGVIMYKIKLPMREVK